VIKPAVDLSVTNPGEDSFTVSMASAPAARASRPLSSSNFWQSRFQTLAVVAADSATRPSINCPIRL